MNAQAFFGAMARLMKNNAPHQSDRALADQFIRIGVRPGEDFDIERLDPAVRRGLARADDRGAAPSSNRRSAATRRAPGLAIPGDRQMG